MPYHKRFDKKQFLIFLVTRQQCQMTRIQKIVLAQHCEFN